jgi:tRNA nucleotidyltransferase/poly(A) polymerase
MNDQAIKDTIRRAVGRHPLLSGLAARAAERSWSVLVVGGWVRDRLLRRRSRDIDLILGEGAREILAWLAERSSHRIVTFEQRVVNHRLTIDGARVDAVESGTRSLTEELARRDFRVNAVAWDLPRGRLADPCGGLAQIAEGVLEPPRDDAFRRDPLRALRGVRLACEIDALRLGARARVLARSAAPGLRGVAAERVLEELDRILLSRGAADAIRDADRLGLLETWIPEVNATKGLAQNRSHHLDVWEHTLAALALSAYPGRLGRGLIPAGWPDVDREPEDPPRPRPRQALLVLRWSLLLHDLAKPDTLAEGPEGQRTFHRHELVGAERAEEIGRRLAMPRERIRAIRLLVRQHLRIVIPPAGEMTERALGRVVRALGAFTEVLVLHSLADQGATRGPGWRRVRIGLRRTARRLLEKERQLIALGLRGRLVDGRDVMRALGVESGPQVGRFLRAIEELRDDGKLLSREEALAWLESRRSDRGGR